MAELVDALALGASGRKTMEVRVLSPVPLGNSSVFWKPKCGTREARPKDSRRIPPTNSEFLARLRALIFRQEAGSKAEAILT